MTLLYWLVVSTPLNNMKVSWDYYSQHMEKNVPNHQPVMHFVYKPQHMVTRKDCRKKHRRSLINRKSTLKQHHTACGYAKGLPTSNMKPASVTIHCNHDVTIARMTRKNHTVTKLFPLQNLRRDGTIIRMIPNLNISINNT